MKTVNQLASWLRRSGFAQEAEEIKKLASIQRVLLLVHPDCVVENGAVDAAKYLKKLQSEIPKFDYIITHFMYSDKYEQIDYVQDLPYYDILVELRKFLRDSSNTWLHDRSMGRKSFEGVVADYLMEYNNLEIYLGGGYQNLCLKDTYNNFCNILDWVVDEQGHKVKIYFPLVFTRNGSTLTDPGWMNEIRTDELEEEYGRTSEVDTRREIKTD